LTAFSSKDESAASSSLKVAACVPNMFHNFYLLKGNKTVNNSTTTKDKENSANLESVEF